MTTAKPPKVALVTAINTENGAELKDFLLLNDYQVHGIQCGQKPCEEQFELPVRQGVTLHDSDRLVAQQFTQALADMACGREDSFFVESFDTLGYWAQPLWAARTQGLMLQQPQANDSLLNPGAPQTLRQFMASTAADHGIQLTFKGQGHDEYAVVVKVDQAKAPALSEGQVILGILPKQGASEGGIRASRKIDCEFIEIIDFAI